MKTIGSVGLTAILILAATGSLKAQSLVGWHDDLQEAQRVAAESGKLVLIHFWSETCGPCRKLESTVFPHPEFARSVQDGFVPVKVNTTEYPELARQYGVRRIPQDIYLTPDGKVLHQQISPSRREDYIQLVNHVSERASQLGETQFGLPTQRVPNIGRSADSVRVVDAGSGSRMYLPPERDLEEQVRLSDQRAAANPFPAPTRPQAHTEPFDNLRHPVPTQLPAQGQSLAASRSEAPSTPSVSQSFIPSAMPRHGAHNGYAPGGEQANQGIGSSQHSMPNSGQPSTATQAAFSDRSPAGIAENRHFAGQTQESQRFSDLQANRLSTPTSGPGPQALTLPSTQQQPSTNPYSLTGANQQGIRIADASSQAGTYSAQPPTGSSRDPGRFRLSDQQSRAGQSESMNRGTDRPSAQPMETTSEPHNRFQLPSAFHQATPNASNLDERTQSTLPLRSGSSHTPPRTPIPVLQQNERPSQPLSSITPEYANSPRGHENPYRLASRSESQTNSRPNPTQLAPNSAQHPSPQTSRDQSNLPVSPSSNVGLTETSGAPDQSTAADTSAPIETTPALPPLGLEGYCPVTLSEQKEWQKGSRSFGCYHRGRLYLFASATYRDRFLTFPDRFAPILSGFDPVVFAESGELIDGKREYGGFAGGRVFLFVSEESLARFSTKPEYYSENALQAMGISTARIGDQGPNATQR